MNVTVKLNRADDVAARPEVDCAPTLLYTGSDCDRNGARVQGDAITLCPKSANIANRQGLRKYGSGQQQKDRRQKQLSQNKNLAEDSELSSLHFAHAGFQLRSAKNCE
jgi:hypothetical protein